jgi:chaperonin GroES
MINLEPIGDRIVLRKLDSGAEISGLIIPETLDQLIKAEVIAVGPGRFLECGTRAPVQCKVGDIVYVNKLACAPATIPLDESGEFYLIPENDVGAILRTKE